jgi:hypothetical protein
LTDWASNSASPASLNYSTQQPGCYYLVASNLFGVANSQAAYALRTAAWPRIQSTRVALTNLQFNIKGNPEVIYVLLESSNLVDWTTNKTFQLDSTNASLLIPTNSADRMFYRLQEW